MHARAARRVGRYAIYGEIASGGMATVHLGKLLGAEGVSRVVAVKRLHDQYAKDPALVAMFRNEARVAARIRHPSVVSLLDFLMLDGELFLVMEYVQGETLARLVSGPLGDKIPAACAAAIVAGALHGLHAAHIARGEQGEPLGVVHRDVSPQNIMVGTDGVARVLDFGIAKAMGCVHTTREGQLKGKLAYMAPEQIDDGGVVDSRTDVYAAGVVLWEALAGTPLFRGDNEARVLAKVLSGEVLPPSRHCPNVSGELDAVVLRALERESGARYPSALEMALALEDAIRIAPPRVVGEWVSMAAAKALASRAEQVERIERDAASVEEPSGVVRRVNPPSKSAPGAPNRGRAVAAVAFLSGLVIPVAIVWATQARYQGATPPEPAPPAAASPSPPSELPVAATAPHEASENAVDVAPGGATSATTEPSRARAPVPRPSAPGAVPKVDCTNPFQVDSSGIQRVRRECLR